MKWPTTADLKELDRVLEGEPWSFDYSLLVLKWVEDMENLDLADFSIQISGYKHTTCLWMVECQKLVN